MQYLCKKKDFTLYNIVFFFFFFLFESTNSITKEPVADEATEIFSSVLQCFEKTCNTLVSKALSTNQF